MSVRAKRGRRWPDEYGNYEIVQDQHNGSVLQWVDRGTFGPDTEAVAERILAAINGDTVPAPTLPAPTLPDDLPSWVSMHATATGADLIEHDPNGDEWGRWHGGCWSRHHADTANPDDTYLVRRRPQPSTPDVVKVPWAESLGRRIPDGREITAIGYRSGNPHPWFEVDGGGDFLPDGTVEVLVESDR